VPQAILTEARRTGELSPLDYMLAVINDTAADPARRDRLAVCAAQYVHPKAGDLSKKDAEAEAAEKAGSDSEWAGDLL
jgi:phage terminase small subunit